NWCRPGQAPVRSAPLQRVGGAPDPLKRGTTNRRLPGYSGRTSAARLGGASGDFFASSGALPAARIVTTLLSMSNQNGAPRETANDVSTSPRAVLSQPHPLGNLSHSQP